MPKNLNAIIRYHTIDQCLQNPYRRWTIKDLQEACSDALYDARGRESRVSERTVRDDIRIMRSDILGYNAPIAVENGCYYYTDRAFSITHSPLAQHDIEMLAEVAGILKQLSGFRHFKEITELIKRIENKLSAKSTETSDIIQIDQVPELKGMEWLDILRGYIQRNEEVFIHYHPFHHKKPLVIRYSPYLLKEYNRRWFVIGRSEGYSRPGIFALDRIQAIHPTGNAAQPNTLFDKEKFFQYIIGVTIPQDEKVQTVELKVHSHRAGYVKTKPLHPTQHVIKETEEGLFVQLHVMINQELISTILFFGKDIEILSPQVLIDEIKKHVAAMAGYYD